MVAVSDSVFRFNLDGGGYRFAVVSGETGSGFGIMLTVYDLKR